MKLSDFDYYLPEELIAQMPIDERDKSRLMILDRKTGKIEHKHFYDIFDELNKGDVLVLNDTKVIPARLIGSKVDTGAVIELLLLKDLGGNTWECLSRPAKRLKEGTIIKFSDKLEAIVKVKKDDGIVHVELIYQGILMEILDELGFMPLPPYIERPDNSDDRERYQTVYCKDEGSVAAPTAGLHFTEELLKKAEEKA